MIIGARPSNLIYSHLAKRFTNAYMTVYVREQDMDEVLSEWSESDIPHHLRERLEREKELMEQRRREREEQHLYMNAIVSIHLDDVFCYFFVFYLGYYQ